MRAEIGGDYSDAVAYSHKIANRRPFIPEAQLVEGLEPPPRREVEERVWNSELLVWELEPTQLSIENHAPRRSSAIPVGDGSGVFWSVIDKATGVTMWVIERVNFVTALDEKRVLCTIAGYSSGGFYISQRLSI